MPIPTSTLACAALGGSGSLLCLLCAWDGILVDHTNNVSEPHAEGLQFESSPVHYHGVPEGPGAQASLALSAPGPP